MLPGFIDSERGNFKLFGLIYISSSFESLNFFGPGWLLKKRVFQLL